MNRRSLLGLIGLSPLVPILPGAAGETPGAAVARTCAAIGDHPFEVVADRVHMTNIEIAHGVNDLHEWLGSGARAMLDELRKSGAVYTFTDEDTIS